jgi:hypothetical protein
LSYLSAITAMIGVLGALGGVVVGSMLSSRAQRELLRAAHRREDRQVRENAYVAFLANYRRFRHFVLTEALEVTVVTDSLARGVPLIKDSQEHADAIHEATARLYLLEGEDTPVIRAVLAVQMAFDDLARARATHPSGAIPLPAVQAAREAEKQFTRAAQLTLSSFDAPRG